VEAIPSMPVAVMMEEKLVVMTMAWMEIQSSLRQSLENQYTDLCL
jgi:hypothetical protein